MMTSSLSERLRAALGPKERPSPPRDLAARRHHYEFAHVALRNTFFSKPEPLARALMARREELLRTIWSDVGDEIVKHEGKEARLPPEGLALTMHKINPQSYAFIVTLPPPEGRAEAHFVAMAVQERRFFTLEHGLHPRTGDAYTVLCEWQGQKHLNLGAAPPATADAFAYAVSDLVNGKIQPHVRGSAEPRAREGEPAA
jgi:hypothetical protein